jgi:hypothetical protein
VRHSKRNLVTCGNLPSGPATADLLSRLSRGRRNVVRAPTDVAGQRGSMVSDQTGWSLILSSEVQLRLVGRSGFGRLPIVRLSGWHAS